MKAGDFLTELARAARNEYMKEWRRNNPGKIKAYQEKHWAKKAAAMNMSREKDGVKRLNGV